MIGPGKYDDICTEVREKTKARSVLVIIIGGNKGEGFSVQSDIGTLMKLPTILRNVADQIGREGFGGS